MLLLDTIITYQSHVRMNHNQDLSLLATAIPHLQKVVQQLAMDAFELLISPYSRQVFEENKNYISGASEILSHVIILKAASNYGNNYIFYSHCAQFVDLAVHQVMQILRANLPENIKDSISQNVLLQSLQNLLTDAASGWLVGAAIAIITNNKEILHVAARSALSSLTARIIHIGLIESAKCFAEHTNILKNNEFEGKEVKIEDYSNNEKRMLRISYVLKNLLPMLLVERFFNVNSKLDGLAAGMYKAATKDSLNIFAQREAAFTFYNI